MLKITNDYFPLVSEGRLTLQGNAFARKGKWKESGRFWQSAELARNGKCSKDKRDFTRSG